MLIYVVSTFCFYSNLVAFVFLGPEANGLTDSRCGATTVASRRPMMPDLVIGIRRETQRGVPASLYYEMGSYGAT